MSLTQQQCNEFWKLADKNDDGNLTVQELGHAIRKYKPDILDSEVAGMFCCIDKDGDSRISYREFLQEMVERQKRAVQLRDYFKSYDKDGNGSLSRGEVLTLIKEVYHEDDAHCVIGKFLAFSDKDGDGVVTWDEFVHFFG